MDGSQHETKAPSQAPPSGSAPDHSTEAEKPPKKRLDRKPKPKLRRVNRGLVALVGISVMCLLMILTLRYSRESLTGARFESPDPPGPPPAPLERIERYEVPSEPPVNDDHRPGAQAPRLDLSQLQPQRPGAAPTSLAAALKSSLIASKGRLPSGSSEELDSGASLPSWRDLAHLESSGALTLPSSDSHSPVGMDSAPVGTPAARRRNLLPQAGDASSITLTADDPVGPAIRAGSFLPAVLTHRVVSDQPGQLRAVLTRDVYDSLWGTHLLLPRGTVLLGEHHELPSLGQTRLAVIWNRLQLPSGRTYQLDSQDLELPSTSVDGSSGVIGKTRHHWGRRFGAAALISLLGAGVQLSQPERTATREVTTGETAAGALGLELGRLSETILRKHIDLPPTIELPAGTRLGVFVPADLIFHDLQ